MSEPSRLSRSERLKRNRQDRINNTPFEKIPHGVTGYVGYNCRCDTCRTEGTKDRRDKRRSQKGLPESDPRHGTNNAYTNYRCRCDKCCQAQSERKREWDLKTRYGISESEYREIWRRQSGLCAICKTELGKSLRNSPVDHDHDTGRVRGILCIPCNVGLGRSRDSIGILGNAISYLTGRLE